MLDVIPTDMVIPDGFRQAETGPVDFDRIPPYYNSLRGGRRPKVVFQSFSGYGRRILSMSEVGPVDSGSWTHQGLFNDDHFRFAATAVENSWNRLAVYVKQSEFIAKASTHTPRSAPKRHLQL